MSKLENVKESWLLQEIEILKSKLATSESKMEKLLSELLFLRRQLFGHKTERYIPKNPDQLSLYFEGLDILPEEEQDYDEVVIEVASYIRTPTKEKKIPTRQPIPEHLRRVDETIQPEGVDVDKLVWMKDEITEVMEYIPGEIYVRRIIRPQYVSKSDEKIYIGELPSLPLPKSNAGASLLAQLLVSKYVDHLPVHRHISLFKRDNVPIAASTVNDWFHCMKNCER